MANDSIEADHSSPLLEHSQLHSSPDHQSPPLDRTADNSTEEEPFLTQTQSHSSPALTTHRTGTIWTAMAHIITGVMGAGVLSLGWSLAQLGWFFGIFSILVFAAVTAYSTSLLSDCYRSPDSESGPERHTSFIQAVRFYLGGRREWICALVFKQSLIGNDIAYTIATATSISKTKLMEEDGTSVSDALLLHTKRSGNIWTAFAHIITGVIGSGVLSLSWSVAQLGWVAGPISLVLFALVTLLNATLLSNLHIYPDPNNSVTILNRSYLQAVENILGNLNGRICSLLVYFNLFKLGVVYTITSAISIRAIKQSNCYHEKGHEAECEYGIKTYMILFGVIQIIASQIPNFHSTKWLSVIAAIMSFAYSFIGSGLGLAKTIGNGKIKGSIGGVPTAEPIQKVWLVAQAIGDIAFAYPFYLILLEIQSTLKSPPPEEVTMKKASRIAVFTTSVFYLCCGGFGYAAFGNSTPGNILSGFGFYEPYWLIDFANACVFLHLVGGYQIFSQTLYGIVERWYADKYLETESTSNRIFRMRRNPFRFCFRISYVVLTTSIAMVFPYFNEVVAFAGSVTFWPLVVYFPVEMYLVRKRIESWTNKWIALRIFTVVCLFVSLFAFVGSIHGLIAKRFG